MLEMQGAGIARRVLCVLCTARHVLRRLTSLPHPQHLLNLGLGMLQHGCWVVQRSVRAAVCMMNYEDLVTV